TRGRGGWNARSAAHVRDAVPARLRRQLDPLASALGLDVDERPRLLVVTEVELALLDPLIEPGAAEDQPSQPVNERALGGADELRPAVVHVFAGARDRKSTRLNSSHDQIS